MAKQWCCKVSGDEQGPFTSDVIREMVKRGEITPETPMRDVAQSQWFRAGRLRALFDDTTPPFGSTNEEGTANREASGAVPAADPTHPSSPPPKPSDAAEEEFVDGSPGLLGRLVVVAVVGATLVLGTLVVAIACSVAKSRSLAEAKRRVSAGIESAQEEMDAGNFDAAEAALREALSVEDSGEKDRLASLLKNVEESNAIAQAEGLLTSARDSIAANDFTKAEALLTEYAEHARAESKNDVQAVLIALPDAKSSEHAIDVLWNSSDEELHRFSQTAELPSGSKMLPDMLKPTHIRKLQERLPAEIARRKRVRRVQEQERLKAERLARITQQRAQREELRLKQELEEGEAKKKLVAKPSEVGATLGQAQRLVRGGDYFAAYQVFSAILSKNPADSEAHYLRGRLNVSQRGVVRAVKSAVNYAAGETMASKAKQEEKAIFAEAVDDLTIAISAAPKDAERYYQRGLAYQNVEGASQAAYDDFTRAISLNPAHRNAYIARGKSWPLYWSYSQEAGLLAYSDLTKAIALGSTNDLVSHRDSILREVELMRAVSINGVTIKPGMASNAAVKMLNSRGISTDALGGDIMIHLGGSTALFLAIRGKRVARIYRKDANFKPIPLED